MNEKTRHKNLAKHMRKHNQALGKAKGVRIINFSLTPLVWLGLWIKMNPGKAQEMYTQDVIREATGSR